MWPIGRFLAGLRLLVIIDKAGLHIPCALLVFLLPFTPTGNGHSKVKLVVSQCLWDSSRALQNY